MPIAKSFTPTKILKWLAIALIASIALLALRVAVAPVSVSFLHPYMSAALADRIPGYTVEFEETVLASGGMLSAFDIRVRDVRILKADGKQVASIPEISLGLGLVSVLTGDLVPRRLGFYEPTARFVRAEDGSMSLSDRAAGSSDSGGFLLALIESLSQDNSDENAAGGLERVSIIDAQVDVEDLSSQASWEVRALRLVFSRTGNGLAFETSGSMSVGEKKASFAASGSRQTASGDADLAIELRQVIPSSFMSEFGPSRSLRGIDLPIDAHINASFNADGDLRTAKFQLTASSGNINVLDALEAPIKVETISLEGEIDRTAGDFRVDRFLVQADGASIEGDARLYISGEDEKISLSASVDSMPVPMLVQLWPADVKASARMWIKRNVTDGVFSEGTLKVNLSSSLLEADVIPADALVFDFTAKDVEVHFLRPLPPGTRLGGKGTLTAGGLEIVFEDGVIRDPKNNLDIIARPVSVKLSDLNLATIQYADVDATFTGSASDVVTLLDYPPLEYSSGYGISPEDVEGDAVLRAQFRLPLLKDLTLDQLDLSVVGTMSDVSFPGLAEDLALEGGEFDVDVDNDGLTARGGLNIAGVPAQVEWREAFGTTEGNSTQFDVAARLSGDKLRQLSDSAGIPIDGEVGVDVSLSGSGFDVAAGQLSLDFLNAEMEIGLLGWTKSIGTPMQGGFAFHSEGESLINDALTLNGAGLTVEGEIGFSTAGRVETVNIDKLTYAETDISVLARIVEGQPVVVDIRGTSFGGSPILDLIFAEDENDTSRSLEVDIAVDRFVGHEGVVVTGLDGFLRQDPGGVTEIFVAGSLEEGDMMASVIQGREGPGELSIYSDDAGQLLKAVGLFSDGVGGQLYAHASLQGEGPRARTIGTATIVDTRLVNAPGFAKVLNVGSLTGIGDNLSGQGVTFDRVHVDYDIGEDEILLRDAQAIGPSLGVRLEGRIFDNNSQVALQGTLAPAYTLNSIFKRVPVIGGLLTGGKGGGIIAFRFSMDGAIDDPDVSVNPLSALTPGVFRNVFSLFGESAPKASKDKEKSAE